ncbi:hypothetical protein HGI30_16035 [Paenibacillus albicereus]|uniref:Uncharacterized protein n=1 Tax=Paenibacillus albicereus TaxID=2726185 RepID=A0A6H2H0Q1_9BACL|nr:hypothetical protein [Paenibacillus albicereus]QJC52928.1 hypothetical protein HGI30_16035 [Paenibacillus albicereus]
MREIFDEVSRFFAEMRGESMSTQEASEFVEVVANCLGGLIALHHAEENFGELCANIGSQAERNAIRVSKMPEIVRYKAKKNEK